MKYGSTLLHNQDEVEYIEFAPDDGYSSYPKNVGLYAYGNSNAQRVPFPGYELTFHSL